MPELQDKDSVIKIRSFLNPDLESLFTIYQKAFAGFPWFENLSMATVQDRINSSIVKPRNICLVAIEANNSICGAVWGDEISLADLITERGSALAEWADAKSAASGHQIFWEREIMVDPDYQRRGIGALIRTAFISKLESTGKKYLLLTRMRDDNIGTIKIAERLGYQRTGIRKAATQAPLFHEYWYRFIN